MRGGRRCAERSVSPRFSATGAAVVDLCRKADGQGVAGLQEIEIGIVWMIGPVQNVSPAVGLHAVERYGARGFQGGKVHIGGQHCQPVVLDNGVSHHRCGQLIPDVGVTDAKCSRDRGGKLDMRRRNSPCGNIIDLESV